MVSTRRIRWVWIPLAGFVIALIAAKLILGSFGYGFLFGALMAAWLFVSQLRWMDGQYFGIISGDNLEPTEDEAFDQALKSLKEKRDKTPNVSENEGESENSKNQIAGTGNPSGSGTQSESGIA